ncbi:hypothetical protein LZD49_02490 [Dyadobacter sp. CY261]|uniref:hypothetical protein n=1 Tax=Dyadobacter sp. CY261 TaxID=2907203 RepID=UPI001F2209F7|nr:hypothetical protein [Dyadobacter sp. CY261]MCF0069322.1 hypothetical protein [Dyadobacter sp. CY261]
MNEPILLPIEYSGTTHDLPVTIVPLGYTYQLHVDLGGKTLIFEKDDQDKYRVIDQSGEHSRIDRGFVAAIVNTLDAL